MTPEEIKYDEYIKRVKKVYNVYLANPVSMSKLEEITGIDRATCNRYLNDKDLIQIVGKTKFNLAQKYLKGDNKSIDIKVLKVVSTFIEHPVSMIELEALTGISKSSCQRYLNDKERIVSLLDLEAYDLVQKLLKENRTEARIYGGEVSSMHNEAIKDEQGKFVGNVRRG